VELSAVEYRLLCQLAGEPTRVLTKVNFELRPEEGKGSKGFRARGGIGDPLPLGGSGRLTTEHRGFLGSANGGFGPEPFRD
jgi:hypothetical protein